MKTFFIVILATFEISTLLLGPSVVWTLHESYSITDILLPITMSTLYILIIGLIFHMLNCYLKECGQINE